VVARQRLAGLELDLQAAAVLTAVAVAREEEGVRNLAAEAAWNMDEAHQPDHRRARSVNFSERTTRSESASTISAFPSITSRRARAAAPLSKAQTKRSVPDNHDQALLLGKLTKYTTSTPGTTSLMRRLAMGQSLP